MTDPPRQRDANGARPVLASKLRVPSMPPHHVRRPRLIELVDVSAGAPLALVAAPAGAGKTVLLASWAIESTTPVAWCSVDESDTDVTAFWSAVAAALRTIGPGGGASVRPGPTPDIEDVIHRLLGELDTSLVEPTVLVIDDLHLAADEEVLASLSVFLQHLPSLLHVIVSSRHVPALPLERLRARGQLGEVHFAELAFSPEEATAMLASLCPSLPADDVDDIVTSTGGWAAGLHLAALGVRAARARPDNARAPSSERILIGDYITREVLAKEDPALVGALFDVAVVERVNDALACVLCERDDAGDLLVQAEARGLFVHRLAPDGWYEVHPLVRSVLLAERARRDPERLRAGRIRAAVWLEGVGDVVAALDQWQAAGEHHEALRLLSASHVQLYDSGRESTIRAVIAATPADARAADLESLVAVGWCSLLVSRPQFLDVVEQATWWAARNGSAGGRLGARLMLLRAIGATITGDWTNGATLARLGVLELGGEWSEDPIGRTGWNLVAREIALSERWDDDADEVREVSLVVRHDSNRVLALEATRALGHALAGRPLDALRVAAGIRAATEGRRMGMSLAELAIAEAIAMRELGDASRARVVLEGLLHLDVEPMTYVRALARLELVQWHLDGGDAPGAEAALASARELIEVELPGPGGRGWLARRGTVLAIAIGDLAAADAWSAQDDDPFWGPIDAARVHLARGEPRDAATAIADVVPRCPRHEVVLALVQARATSDHEIAVKWVTRAIEQATATGLLQTVAAEGPTTLDLVERAAWLAPERWMDRLRRVAAVGSALDDCRSPAQVEALTERERDVLRFLPSRLTIAEIADELYVSVNTLKFHLKIIYRKLGVGSRAEASVVARSNASLHRAP
jgi:LuxR family maltose regulon positive regulatory protein